MRRSGSQSQKTSSSSPWASSSAQASATRVEWSGSGAGVTLSTSQVRCRIWTSWPTAGGVAGRRRLESASSTGKACGSYLPKQPESGRLRSLAVVRQETRTFTRLGDTNFYALPADRRSGDTKHLRTASRPSLSRGARPTDPPLSRGARPTGDRRYRGELVRQTVVIEGSSSGRPSLSRGARRADRRVIELGELVRQTVVIEGSSSGRARRYRGELVRQAGVIEGSSARRRCSAEYWRPMFAVVDLLSGNMRCPSYRGNSRWSAGLERRSLTGTRPGGPRRRTAPGPDGAGTRRRAIRACRKYVFARRRRAVPVRDRRSKPSPSSGGAAFTQQLAGVPGRRATGPWRRCLPTVRRTVPG